MKTITDIEGVFASGTHCGIKETKPDIAFIYIPEASASAGVFTRNHFTAPCIVHTRSCLPRNVLKGVIVNSGNANAATGEEGSANTREMASRAGVLLGLAADEVAVASTGIIGKQLPMERVRRGIFELLQQPRRQEGTLAAEAIMTTDTRAKHAYRETAVHGTTLQVAGIAKGSGMIAPNMATMLAFLTTNAAVSQPKLQALLHQAVDDSFNMMSVDNDTSPNDMVLAFSTGRCPLKDQAEELEFASLLMAVCRDLARAIAADGEGAHRVIEVEVREAASRVDARRIAKSIINSPLVKTAIHGADPNWGRIIAAAGKCEGVAFETARCRLWLQGFEVFAEGQPVADLDRQVLKTALQKPEVKIELDLSLGKHSATGWGCDLSQEYVEINAEYN